MALQPVRVVDIGGGRVMKEVRILARIHSTGAEPDLPFLLVDLDDATDDPVAFGDLVLDVPVAPSKRYR